MNITFNNPNEHWYYNDRYDAKEPERLKGCFYCVITAIIVFVVVLLMTSCKSIQYVPVVETQIHHDSIYFTNVQFDSIYVHDSISYKEKGDTVILEKWHTKYKEKQVHDTIYQSKTDSIRIPEPYPVEKQLTKWQKTKMEVGGYSIVACTIFIVMIVVGLYLKARKRE